MTSLWHKMQHLKTLATYLACALSRAAVMAVILIVSLSAAEVKSPSRLRQLVSNVMSVCNIGIEGFGDEAAYHQYDEQCHGTDDV
ncbi:hypothetical protein [Brucella oryzae]|uniref:hypothetical protein n=1 Tax=Brucella oryzae TaxID=335286 RepID=UPI00142E31B5|nr:hypothetical protein [Brucella oryzae]